MKPSKSTLYLILNLCLGVLFFFAARYFWLLTTTPLSDRQRPGLLVEGLVLFVAASVTVVLRAYYRRDRFRVVDESPAASEASALGLLGAARLKPITLRLEISDDEYRELEHKGELWLTPDRFNMPIKRGDIVRLCTGLDSLERCLITRIDDIDGYNQRVTLKHQGVHIRTP